MLNRLMAFATVLLTLVAPAPAQNPLIFKDGFESRSTNAWSMTVNPSNITITLIDTSASSPVSSHEEWADYQVEFTIYASAAADLYFEKEAARGTNPDVSKGFWFSIENGSGVVYNGGTTPFSISASCPCTGDTPTHFKVAAGTMRTFWLNVRLDNAGGTAGFYRMRLTGLSHKGDGNNGDGTVLITTGLSGMVTSTVFVANQNTGNLTGVTAYDDFHRRLATSNKYSIATGIDPVENNIP